MVESTEVKQRPAEAQKKESIKQELSIGKKFQQARDAKKLGIEEAAKALRINKQRIIDIENDNYQSMPASIYVQSYLKRYAQLVGLPPAEILKQFNQYQTAQLPKHEPLSARANKQVLCCYKNKFCWVIAAIFLAVLFLIAAWLYHINYQKAPRTTLLAQQVSKPSTLLQKDRDTLILQTRIVPPS